MHSAARLGTCVGVQIGRTGSYRPINSGFNLLGCARRTPVASSPAQERPAQDRATLRTITITCYTVLYSSVEPVIPRLGPTKQIVANRLDGG